MQATRIMLTTAGSLPLLDRVQALKTALVADRIAKFCPEKHSNNSIAVPHYGVVDRRDRFGLSVLLPIVLAYLSSVCK